MSASRKPKTINPDKVDPSIYLYDEIYDEMKNEETKETVYSDRAKEKAQSSKYIQGLIETADRRKSEKELRKFRRFARDREVAEAEGELDEADVYITPTYKKKLEEMQRINEAKRRRLESEKDRAMNFSRTHGEKSEDLQGGKSPDCRDNSKVETRPQHPVSMEINASPSSERDKVQNLSPKPSHHNKRPKTIEERKEYLRQVLAKRTIGPVFEAAVQRYKERKANKLTY